MAFIPAFGKLGVFEAGGRGDSHAPPDRPVRIIDLATHTSGLTYEWMNASSVDAAYLDAGIGGQLCRRSRGDGRGVWQPADRVLARRAPELLMGMDVMARIVEVVSGMLQ